MLNSLTFILGGALLLYVMQRFLWRPQSTPTDIARKFLRESARVAVVIVVLIVVGTGLRLGAQLDGIIGSVSNFLAIALLVTAAAFASLFIARQFLAPPWWRLNAWNNDSFAHEYDGSLFSILAWIWTDSVAVILDMRPLDRLVILLGVPAACWDLAVIVGTREMLTAVFGVLFVLYIALGVALFTANRIPRVLLSRLQELRGVARRIATGDLSARVGYSELGEYEELSELVADVNFMARSIEGREQENHALHSQLHQTLQYEQERATRDPLTQLRNHRYFQEALAAELYRCARTNEVCTIAIIDLDNFKAVNDTYGHSEGDLVLQRVCAMLEETLRPYDLAARLGGEEFGVIFPATDPEEAKGVLDRMMQSLDTSGPENTPLTFSGGISSFPLHATDQATLYQIADSSSYAAKHRGKAQTVVYDSGVDGIDQDRGNSRERDEKFRAARMLVETVDQSEGFGSAHSENVGQLGSQIAIAMGFDDAFARQVYLCGLLHDVGKVGVEQTIVQKASQLTEDEYEQIKRHPELGAQIVANAGLGDVAVWIRHHHEHWDGSGYPMQLVATDIPLPSRIVLVAEAFDVMTSDRSYRRAMSMSDAFDELMRGAGSRFDPDVVTALLELAKTGEVRASGGAPPVGGNWTQRAA